MLESAGFDVVGEADDGASAMDAIERLAPGLIVLDVQLPDVTGFTLCEKICGGERPPDVILVSSRDVSDYGELVSSSAARGFVPKGELSADIIDELLA